MNAFVGQIVGGAFQQFGSNLLEDMVGPGGLEPLTSSVSRKRSNQLSYGPTAAESFS